MASQDIRGSIQSAYRQYLAGKGIKARHGQRHMIAEIVRYLESIQMDGEFERTSDPGCCVIEAGTGTGKTLGYLLATIPVARHLRKTIVVSTATVTLQQQIIETELPALRQYTDLDFSVALAKGRGRYLCMNKVDQALGDGQQTFLGFTSEEAPDADDKASSDGFGPERYQALLDWMVDQGWDGDLDKAPEPVEEGLRQRVTTDHRQCLNKRCAYFHQCPYFKNKAAQEQADVVVANHDLVFSDLSLGGGFVLPAPERSIYVFDEAHHLADKALNHFAYAAGLRSSQKLLKQLTKTLADGQIAWSHDEKISGCIVPISSASSQIHQLLDRVQALLNSTVVWPPGREQRRDYADSVQLRQFRFPMGVIPEDLKALAIQLHEQAKTLCSELDTVVKQSRELLDKEKQGSPARAQLESATAALGVQQGQVENFASVWREMQKDEPPEVIPSARWLTSTTSEGDGDIFIHVSPTNAAALLKQWLWQRAFGAVLTSATLSVNQDFRRLKQRAGLPEGSVYSIHVSPFNFQENGELQLCDLGEEPSDQDSYLKKLSAGIAALISPEEATLVLFSAKKHMHFVVKELAAQPALEAMILVQGGTNKAEILKQHRQRIDEGAGSILFGLDSFAEGLDLPGNYLTHVIIAKLPFSVPDEPVDATFAEWLKNRGGNPFGQVALPDAITKLLQACGRLMRNEHDRGRISILDRRLWSRRYGNDILNALPPFRRSQKNLQETQPLS